jgi:voltage-gated potassium channel
MNHLNRSSQALSQRVLSMFKHPTFAILTLVGNSTIVVSAAVFYYLERGINPQLINYLDALWWAVSTCTTVGDGRIVPYTFWGKILGISMMIFGTALFCSFTALFSTILMGFKFQEVEGELAQVDKRVQELSSEFDEDELALNETIQKLESTLKHLMNTKNRKKN